MTVPQPPRVPRLTLTALLTLYVAALVGIRTHQDPTVATTRAPIHMITACTLFLVAWILYRRGGQTRWPTLLPLAIAQGLGLVLYTLSRRTPKTPSQTQQSAPPYDAFIAIITVAIAAGIMLYGIIPSSERWARHVGVLACVACGLPTALLVPSLRRVTHAARADPDALARIRRAARVSGEVYSKPRHGDATLEFLDPIHEPTTGARCVIAIDRTNPERVDVCVAFAGSDTKVDWLRTNVNVQVEDLASLESVRGCEGGIGGAVHKGVLDAWKSIRERVWTEVSNQLLLRGGSATIVMCGHSLGGAMATVAAVDMACSVDPAYVPSLTLISFGSPAIGDAAFARSVAARVPTSIRVTTVTDPVPKLVIRDFVHVETEYPVVTSVENPVTAHFMTSYLRALEAPPVSGLSRLATTAVGAMVVLGVSSVLAWRRDD